jgi:molybdopterin-containing oxidoreductase family iron-sulfur binding subunit
LVQCPGRQFGGFHSGERGALCLRGQAALQDIYNPDRIRTPLARDDRGRRAVGVL